MIKVAKNAGFCNGVQKAFDLALKLSEQYDKVYTLGELVHNEIVTKFLESKHIFCLKDSEFDKLKSGDVALIRAHGLDKNIEQELSNRGVILFDATCVVVKKNQELIEQRAKTGDRVIIVGDPNHDEVRGYTSYADYNCEIVRDTDHIELNNVPTSILFQTTILKEKFESIEFELKNLKNFNDKLVGIFNTCCYNTTIRQREARMLAKESDIVIVVGSCNSANTRRLYEVSKEINEKTYFVSNIEDLKSIKESKQRKVISIVAGASTPPWLIQEVTQLMSEETKAVVEEQKEANLQVAEPVTMEDLLKSEKTGYVEYRLGARVKCKVFSADANGILVTIGGKKDGLIDKEDATCDGNYNPANYKKDDTFFAVIKSVEKDYVKLSKKEIDAKDAANAEAEKALSAGEFELKMTEVVKGGLRAKLGRYTIFVPASQIKIGFVKDLEQYKDKTLRLVLMPPKDETPVEGEEGEAKAKKVSKYLFASQRIILEREKQVKEDAFWNNIHVNDIVTGKVKRFTQFGAFISVKGADGTPHDCLAHVSELSWTKVNDPSKVLKIGDVCDFVVLKLDRETGKVSLGYKQLQKKPYEIAAEKYPIGTVVKGTVHSVHPYGAFILIEDGIDGLVHVSQISHNWIKDANEALKVGEEVEAKIIGFDDNRITLSIKELLPAPEVAEAAEEATEEEKSAKRSSRAKKFEKAADGEAAPKKERKSKKAADEEATEYISGSSNASLGDLLKGLKFDLEVEEEKPAKKTTKKKKADDAE